MATPSNTVELTAEQGGPTDAISSVRFSPSGDKLAIGSWDRSVRVFTYDETKDNKLSLDVHIPLRAPILDITFGSTSTQLFAVGLDHCVLNLSPYLTNPTSPPSEPQILSQHTEPTNKLAFSPTHNILLSTSWDSTLHIHDPPSRNYIRLSLPAKPFALSLSPTRAVLAMSERKVSVYDLQALRLLLDQGGSTSSAQEKIHTEPWQTRESSLKFMTRAVACMPDGRGFATSSIEGRVGVEWFDPDMQKDMYAFKCHRQVQTMEGAQADAGEEQVDIVYPVNALAFHPVHGTFATGGGDGVVALWDAVTKRRLKQYPKLAASVAAMDFHPGGNALAIGVSPGFEDGKEDEEVDRGLVRVVVRGLAEDEAKGKPAKTKGSKAK